MNATSLLAFVSYGLLLFGSLMMIVAAFRTGIWWGLGCLLLPIVSLVYLIAHWGNAKNGFFVQLVGLALLVVVAVKAPGHFPR